MASCPCESEYLAYVERFGRPNRADRCQVFCDNLAKIKAHNTHPESTYTVDVRELHDLTDKERLAALNVGCYKGPRNRANDAEYRGFADNGVTSANWYLQDRVTNVRDQANCGDCWAESATAVVESVYAQDYGEPDDRGDLVQLSVQQLAECSPPEHNRGCEGGWPYDALMYVYNRSSICSEKDYPTVIGDGNDRSCNQTLAKNCSQLVNLGKVVAIPQGNETGLFVAAQRNVVSVAIDASGQGFFGFKDGVYNGFYNGTADCHYDALDHAVVVTGFDAFIDGKKFYVVRNSWGPAYGMSGYIMMQRGTNVCGIAQDAVHVTGGG
jgi:C1A family cysteine protease